MKILDHSMTYIVCAAVHHAITAAIGDAASATCPLSAVVL